MDCLAGPGRSTLARTRWQRALPVYLAASLLVAGFACLAPARVTFAQDEEVLDDATSGTATEPPEKKRDETFLKMLKDGGLVGLVIILLSVTSLGFIIEHFITIRKKTLMPDAVAADLEALIGEGQVDQAIEYCKDPANYSLFATVVLAGLERYKGSEFGFAEYKAAVEEAGEDQTGALYRKTEMLAVIGAIAPMLGLLGTVTGMIKAFNIIAATDAAAKPADLAGGISEALVTTLFGLVVAIPTMCAFSFFRNKIDSLISEAGKRVEQILMPLGRRK